MTRAQEERVLWTDGEFRLVPLGSPRKLATVFSSSWLCFPLWRPHSDAGPLFPEWQNQQQTSHRLSHLWGMSVSFRAKRPRSTSYWVGLGHVPIPEPTVVAKERECPDWWSLVGCPPRSRRSCWKAEYDPRSWGREGTAKESLGLGGGARKEPRERRWKSEQGHQFKPLSAWLRNTGFLLQVVGSHGRVSNRGRLGAGRCWGGSGGQRQDSCEEAAVMRGGGEAKAEGVSLEDRSSSWRAPHWGGHCSASAHHHCRDMCPAWPEFLISQEQWESGIYG